MSEKSNDATQEIGLEAAGARPLFQLSLMGKVGAGILGFWIVIALIGPFLAPFDPTDFVSDDSFAPMSATHWLGTDYIGRDILSRMLYGARLTMSLSFMATVLAFLVGISMGFTAALAGPKTDMVISRIYDAFLSMPTIMLGLVVIAALGSSVAFIAQTFSKLNLKIIIGTIAAVILALVVPATISAYYKLSKRDLSAILEGSGWGVNPRMKLTKKQANTFTRRPYYLL